MRSPQLDTLMLEAQIKAVRRIVVPRRNKSDAEDFWSGNTSGMVGASVEGEGNRQRVNMHWPVAAAIVAEKYFAKAVARKNIMRDMIPLLLPRLHRMSSDPQAPGVGDRIAKEMALCELIFPHGKAHLDLGGLDARQKDQLAQAWLDVNNTDRTEHARSASPINNRDLPFMLEMIEGITLTVYKSVDPTAEINVEYDEDTGDYSSVIAMSDAVNSKEHLEAFVRDGSPLYTIGMHAKVRVPNHMAKAICQSEECNNLRKIQQYGTRLMGLSYPESGQMNNSMWNRALDEATIEVVDADELDKTAGLAKEYKGYELTPLPPSNLTER